ncbi:MarR family protein [Botrimarina colliarenosi]|uniref:MarR family protein n=2 Tax=Botrimarina colliarenosi TaxID=2528001 RepID=A0A5C6AFD5_9BACT|nr:MarR family protein [Botrimarina colliarenosi]
MELDEGGDRGRNRSNYRDLASSLGITPQQVTDTARTYCHGGIDAALAAKRPWIRVTPAEEVTLKALIVEGMEEGRSLSIRYLAALIGRSPSTVARALKRLKNAELARSKAGPKKYLDGPASPG